MIKMLDPQKVLFQSPSEHNAPASPTGSDRKVESPKEDKPPSAQNRDVPSQNGGDQNVGAAESPVPVGVPSEHNAPASPTGSDRKVESPKEDKPPSAQSRDVPSQNGVDQAIGAAESPVLSPLRT